MTICEYRLRTEECGNNFIVTFINVYYVLLLCASITVSIRNFSSQFLVNFDVIKIKVFNCFRVSNWK